MREGILRRLWSPERYYLSSKHIMLRINWITRRAGGIYQNNLIYNGGEEGKKKRTSAETLNPRHHGAKNQIRQTGLEEEKRDRNLHWPEVDDVGRRWRRRRRGGGRRRAEAAARQVGGGVGVGRRRFFFFSSAGCLARARRSGEAVRSESDG